MIDSHSNLPALPSDQGSYSLGYPPPEEESKSGGFTINQIWQMLRARLWLSVGIFFVLVGLAFFGIKVMPKSYEATTVLIANFDTTDPLAGRKEPGFLNYTFFPTQVELINNNVVLRPVVERLNLKADPEFTAGLSGDAQSINDMIVTRLRSSLHVQPGTNSQLLYITAVAPTPVQAADIANAVADEYLRQMSQRTNAPAIERAARYTAQLEELKQKADAAQERVAEYRQKFGMADLKGGANGDSEGAALSELQNRLIQAQNYRRELEGAQFGPETEGLRTRLVQLETELGEAKATLGARHPRVVQLQSQIETTQNALTGTSAAQIARARALENKFQTAVNEERARLLQRRGLQDDGAKLVLEQQLAQEAYAQALRGYDQIQFASVGNYKDITTVSRAEPPLRSSKPNKAKLFMVAIILGFVLSIGGPFAYELFFNRRIRCRDDLERNFRIITLAQFGRIAPT